MKQWVSRQAARKTTQIHRGLGNRQPGNYRQQHRIGGLLRKQLVQPHWQVTQKNASAQDGPYVQSKGKPLKLEQRDFFEPRLGVRLDGVRVHSDAKAAQLADTIQAKAFTSGHDIYFARGQYSPDTGLGKQLLAHELTHVLQQNSSDNSDYLQRQTAGETAAATAKATKSAAEANRMRLQQTPCIWFDSWSNDARDNDRDGKIDERNEKKRDGIHYPKLYKGRLCDNDVKLKTTDANCNMKNVSVHYRVCIDLPRAVYAAAGIPFPGTRSVVTAMHKLRSRYTRSWKVLMYKGKNKSSFNGTLLPGDFVAQRHGRSWRGHSGVTIDSSNIIHLPGPSRGLSSPSERNDIVKDSGFGHTFVARPKV